jgi:hypothetical protein
VIRYALAHLAGIPDPAAEARPRRGGRPFQRKEPV